MQDSRTFRALSWVAHGGTVAAVATLVTAGVVGATPDGVSPVAAACFSPRCSAAPPAGPAPDRQLVATATPGHAGRVTGRQPRTGAARAARAAVTTGLTRPGAGPGSPAVPVRRPAANGWTNSLPQQHLDAPIVAVASVRSGRELVMVGSDGGVFPVGQAGFYGSLSGRGLAAHIAAVAADPVTGGYWLVGRDGGVFAFHASYSGGLGAARLASPVVAMAATPTGNGYWLVSADGGVFAFGDAVYRGSLSRLALSSPIVAMGATPTGNGYWLVSADGGVFAFGDAVYRGSLSRLPLAGSVVSIVATPTGAGYWMASADGGIFAFGDARFAGSPPRSHLAAPVTSMASTADGRGYWVVTESGNVYAYGDARSVSAPPPPAPAPQAVAAASVVTAAPPAIGPVKSKLRAYPPQAAGLDISQYQCSAIPPSPTGIAVVQVTGGAIDNAPNPCYQAEASWAGANMAAYIYMDGFPATAPPESLSGPAGACDPTNVACASYNYGWFWSRHWVDYSRSLQIDPKMWWIDVERYSGWQDTVSNQLVIRGALDGLRSRHVQPGVYSTAPQWAEITGNMDLSGLPIWVPGAGNVGGPGYTAQAFCSAPTTYGFANGRLELVQYGYQGPFPGTYSGPPTGYDMDYAC